MEAGILSTLHTQDANSTHMRPRGGLQASLCSNNVLSCSTPLGFINFIYEDDAIDYLAEVLVAAFLEQRKNANNTK